MTLRPRRLAAVLLLFVVCTLLCVLVSPKKIPPATYDYRVQHHTVPTQLHTTAPAAAPHNPPSVQPLTYTSDGQTLKVWLARPNQPQPHPVIVYLHAGTALEQAEWDAVQAFVDAGYAVVAPTWRGEHGNPGIYSLCYDEVDDAVAAVQWAAQQPGLDSRRMFAFGNETGGVMAGFLAMYGELPLLATASVSALYFPQDLDQVGVPLPFVDTRIEREMRTLTPFFEQPVLPHIAYLGELDPLVAPHADKLLEASERGGIRINLFWMPTERHSALQPAIQAFMAQIGDE